MNYAQAIDNIKKGHAVRRMKWATGIVIGLSQGGEVHQYDTRAKTIQSKHYITTRVDIFATDWLIFQSWK